LAGKRNAGRHGSKYRSPFSGKVSLAGKGFARRLIAGGNYGAADEVRSG